MRASTRSRNKHGSGPSGHNLPNGWPCRAHLRELSGKAALLVDVRGKTRVYWFSAMFRGGEPWNGGSTLSLPSACWRLPPGWRQAYAPGAGLSSRLVREVVGHPFWAARLNRSLSTGRCRSFLDLSQTQPTRRTIIARPPVRSRSQRRAAVAARRGPVRSVTNWERTVNRLDWPRCAVREPHPAHHRRRCGTICSTLPETRPSWPDQCRTANDRSGRPRPPEGRAQARRELQRHARLGRRKRRLARLHAVRPRTARTIQINKHAPMNPAIR